jgi:hypothetical protein
MIRSSADGQSVLMVSDGLPFHSPSSVLFQLVALSLHPIMTSSMKRLLGSEKNSDATAFVCVAEND